MSESNSCSGSDSDCDDPCSRLVARWRCGGPIAEPSATSGTAYTFTQLGLLQYIPASCIRGERVLDVSSLASILGGHDPVEITRVRGNLSTAELTTRVPLCLLLLTCACVGAAAWLMRLGELNLSPSAAVL